MAQFKLHIGLVTQSPGIDALGKLLKAHGAPAGEPAGIIDADMASDLSEAWGTLVLASEAKVKKLDRQEKVVKEKEISKDQFYPFCFIGAGDLATAEIYSGSAKSLDKLADFMENDLHAGCTVQKIEKDILGLFFALRQEVGEHLRLVSARVRGFQHGDNIRGVYSPKFKDTAEGIDFVSKVSQMDGVKVESIATTYKAKDGQVRIKLFPSASFNYSCRDDAEPEVKEMLRRLAVKGTATGVTVPAEADAEEESE